MSRLKRKTVLVVALGLALIGGPAWARGKIAFSSSAGRLDRLTFKARGVPTTALAPDSEGLQLSLSNVTGLVFSETLTADKIVPNAGRTRWRYSAPREGGIYDLVVAKMLASDGTAIYSVKVRLDADLAATDPARSGVAVDLLAPMVVAVSAGDDALSASASWEPEQAGWRTRHDDFTAHYFGPAKRVFTTSQCYLGSLDGLGGADAKCQSLADVAGLGGVFSAWLADAFDGPSVRLPHASEPYVLVDGAVIAHDWEDLIDGEIAISVHLDEAGGSLEDDGECGSEVWTNTTTLGTPAITDGLEFSCYEWTLSLFSRRGLLGDAMATGATWTDGGALGFRSCSSSARLYCFER